MMTTHRFMTRCLNPDQSTEMFDWLEEHRPLIESVEHTTLDEVQDMLNTFPGVVGLLDGPWLVVLKDDPEEVVYFKLKWC